MSTNFVYVCTLWFIFNLPMALFRTYYFDIVGIVHGSITEALLTHLIHETTMTRIYIQRLTPFIIYFDQKYHEQSYYYPNIMAYLLHQLKIENSCRIWSTYVNGPLIAMGADGLLPTSCMLWCMNYANSLIYSLSMTQENIFIIDLCKNCSHAWSIPVIGLPSMQSGPLIVCTGFCDGFWILLIFIYSCILTFHECLEIKWMQQINWSS